jgi:C4-dicarboxylate-specific signal transduction histidine kinase
MSAQTKFSGATMTTYQWSGDWEGADPLPGGRCHASLGAIGSASEMSAQDMLRERSPAGRCNLRVLLTAQASTSDLARQDPARFAESCLAHELNQSLAAILTSAESALRWLTKESPDLQEATSAIQHMIGCCRRTADELSGVRDLIRRASPAMAPVDVNVLIGKVLRRLDPELQQHGIEVRTDFDTSLGPIHGEGAQLERLLVNLLNNAVDAMQQVDEGERVLRLVTYRSDDRAALVRVEDSGPGLDSSVVDQIFEPFFTTKPKGMGIGLSICRMIVEAHDGRLGTIPNLPRGAVFQFAIPLETPICAV